MTDDEDPVLGPSSPLVSSGPVVSLDPVTTGGRARSCAPPRDQLGDDPVARILELFRTRGGRVTESRRLLIRCLFERRGHRTADELVDAVNALDPAVHRSTIYRNLDELEQLGVIEHVHLGHGPATYHLRSERHGHLVCEHCGQSVEVPEEIFADLERVALGRYGFHLQPRHFAMQGICASCTTAGQPDQSAADPEHADATSAAVEITHPTPDDPEHADATCAYAEAPDPSPAGGESGGPHVDAPGPGHRRGEG